MGKLGSRLTRTLNVMGYRNVLDFLWLVLSWKQGQEPGKAAINQVLAIGANCYKNCLASWAVARDSI